MEHLHPLPEMQLELREEEQKQLPLEGEVEKQEPPVAGQRVVAARLRVGPQGEHGIEYLDHPAAARHRRPGLLSP